MKSQLHKNDWLNISKVAETALKEEVRRLKGESSEPHKRTHNPEGDCNTVADHRELDLKLEG